MRYNDPDDIYGKIDSPKTGKPPTYRAIMTVGELTELLNLLPPTFTIGFPTHGSYLVIQDQNHNYMGFISLPGKFIRMWEGLDK